MKEDWERDAESRLTRWEGARVQTEVSRRIDEALSEAMRNLPYPLVNEALWELEPFEFEEGERR